MALVRDLLQRIRIGENIATPRQDLFDEQTVPTGGTGTVTPEGFVPASTGRCPEGQTWSTKDGRCIPSGESPWGTDLKPKPCPDGQHWDRNVGQCVDDTTPPPPDPPPDPFQECPAGQYKDASGNCVPDIREATKWCAKLGKEIPIGTWSIEMCSEGDDPDEPICIPNWQPTADTVANGQTFTQRDGCGESRQAVGTKEIDVTPDPDDIDEDTGGGRDQLEDEGGDKDTFYDRFPVDYDPSRFGSYQQWLQGGDYNPLQNILDTLDVDIKEKYKGFFADYDWFPESLARTEFGVGRKGLTADLFDLTRQSQQFRQQQGLRSGFPREFERLGMGKTGRQFQALDTAFRKDIFGKREAFTEETIDRLLDLMKSGAEPAYRLTEYEAGTVGDAEYSEDFYSWLANTAGISEKQWIAWGALPLGAGEVVQKGHWNLYQKWLSQQGGN